MSRYMLEVDIWCFFNVWFRRNDSFSKTNEEDGRCFLLYVWLITCISGKDGCSRVHLWAYGPKNTNVYAFYIFFYNSLQSVIKDYLPKTQHQTKQK
jgi:hypothetical protein